MTWQMNFGLFCMAASQQEGRMLHRDKIEIPKIFSLFLFLFMQELSVDSAGKRS
jgi:hypothetical protein